jgi:hypothetical protein
LACPGSAWARFDSVEESKFLAGLDVHEATVATKPGD